MRILNEEWKFIDVFDNQVTIPDCFVTPKNKIGKGHGEAKLYLGNKETLGQFFENKNLNCFVLKSDLLSYLQILKLEYKHPTQNYVGADEFKELFKQRIILVDKLDDIVFFNATIQSQITGARGYINSKDEIYKIIREIALPLVSYISLMKLSMPNGKIVYYFKLFVDFENINDLVFNYGKGGVDSQNIEKEAKFIITRKGQEKYRQSLLSECPFCPITMVNDERLLIASHIKPYALCDEKEKFDPKNGFILSPLFDKLFDKGFITFTENKKMIISNWLTPLNIKRLGLKEQIYNHLPLDDKRKSYLDFHFKNVFKG